MKKSIYYTMSIDSQIYPRQREVYLPNDATAISGAETSDPEGKAKTTRRKEREERVINGSRVRSSRNSVSISLSRNFHLFHIIARNKVPSLLDFLVFYGCTNKGFEGIALPMAREK